MQNKRIKHTKNQAKIGRDKRESTIAAYLGQKEKETKNEEAEKKGQKNVLNGWEKGKGEVK